MLSSINQAREKHFKFNPFWLPLSIKHGYFHEKYFQYNIWTLTYHSVFMISLNDKTEGALKLQRILSQFVRPTVSIMFQT